MNDLRKYLNIMENFQFGMNPLIEPEFDNISSDDIKNLNTLKNIPDGIDLDDNIYKSEILSILKKIVHILPSRQQEVINLYYFEDMSLSEISKKLYGDVKKVSAVTTAINKGLNTIKQYCKDHNIKNEIFEAKEWSNIQNPYLRWLAKYTYEGVDKYPNKKTIDYLLKNFPCKSGDIYRGMNFYTKKEWDEFIDQFNGKNSCELEFNGVSSWSPFPESANQFAVTKPTYFINYEVIHHYELQQKKREALSGYRGIILHIHVNEGQGIDVNSTNVGHEDEIILPPGKYTVSIYKIIKRYEDQLNDNDNTIDNVILSTTKHDIKYSHDNSFYNYVMHHHSDKLSNKAIVHLLKLFTPDPSKPLFTYEVSPYFQIFSSKDQGLDDTKVNFSYYVPMLPLLQLYKTGIFKNNPSIEQQITTACKKIFHQALPIIEKYIVNANSYNPHIINLVASIAGKTNELTRMKQRTLGAAYKELEKNVRNINNISDYREKQQAIRKYGEDMKSLIEKMQ